MKLQRSIASERSAATRRSSRKVISLGNASRSKRTKSSAKQHLQSGTRGNPLVQVINVDVCFKFCDKIVEIVECYAKTISIQSKKMKTVFSILNLVALVCTVNADVPDRLNYYNGANVYHLHQWGFCHHVGSNAHIITRTHRAAVNPQYSDPKRFAHQEILARCADDCSNNFECSFYSVTQHDDLHSHSAYEFSGSCALYRYTSDGCQTQKDGHYWETYFKLPFVSYGKYDEDRFVALYPAICPFPSALSGFNMGAGTDPKKFVLTCFEACKNNPKCALFNVSQEREPWCRLFGDDCTVNKQDGRVSFNMYKIFRKENWFERAWIEGTCGQDEAFYQHGGLLGEVKPNHTKEQCARECRKSEECYLFEMNGNNCQMYKGVTDQNQKFTSCGTGQAYAPRYEFSTHTSSQSYSVGAAADHIKWEAYRYMRYGTATMGASKVRYDQTTGMSWTHEKPYFITNHENSGKGSLNGLSLEEKNRFTQSTTLVSTRVKQFYKYNLSLYEHGYHPFYVTKVLTDMVHAVIDAGENGSIHHPASNCGQECDYQPDPTNPICNGKFSCVYDSLTKNSLLPSVIHVEFQDNLGANGWDAQSSFSLVLDKPEIHDGPKSVEELTCRWAETIQETASKFKKLIVLELFALAVQGVCLAKETICEHLVNCTNNQDRVNNALSGPPITDCSLCFQYDESSISIYEEDKKGLYSFCEGKCWNENTFQSVISEDCSEIYGREVQFVEQIVSNKTISTMKEVVNTCNNDNTNSTLIPVAAVASALIGVSGAAFALKRRMGKRSPDAFEEFKISAITDDNVESGITDDKVESGITDEKVEP